MRPRTPWSRLRGPRAVKRKAVGGAGAQPTGTVCSSFQLLAETKQSLNRTDDSCRYRNDLNNSALVRILSDKLDIHTKRPLFGCQPHFALTKGLRLHFRLKGRNMTIAIGLAVPDGIALAADTQTTWSKAIETAKDKNTGKEFEL